MKRAWALLALPGMAWLAAFFLVAFYAVVAVGLGNVTDVYEPVPHWNPLDWNVGYLLQAIEDVLPGGRTWPVFVRTLIYVVVAVTLSLAIGYPVAYYVSRSVTGRKKALLLVLLVAPFWISYLMRMFAWTNLLADGGYAASVLNALSLDRVFLDGDDWLGGQHIAVIMGLVYGYVPYLILPLYASLDRLDQRLIEAARDLGASPSGAFRRVVIPLTRAGSLGWIVLIELPMFVDYY
jgi:ABC-type spermidine/putrescine transport system permease subunit I